MPKKDQPSSQEKIDRAIKSASIAALVCGGVTLVVGLIAIGGTQLVPGFGGGILLDAVILFGLAFGVYKRSRICAALLVGYGTFNEVYMISSGIDKSSALRLIFIYFYIRGMFATFAYHNHPLLSVSTTQDAPQKQSLKFTVRPSDKSSHAAGNESVDSSKPPREAPSEPDGGSGGEERNLGIQRQRNGSESPIIPANWRFSRKSAFVCSRARK